MGKIKYIPLGLLLLTVAKTLILGAHSLIDPSIILILASMSAFYEYKASSSEIKELQQKLQELSNQNKNLENKFDEVKTAVAGIKMASGMRTVQSR